jgi:hypothetical protein
MWWLPEGAKGAMLSFAIRLRVHFPRFTIVRLDFAQGVFPLECALLLVGMSVMAASTATALPLTPFRYEAQAQRYCPGDTVVWLDLRKGVYYFKRQKRYGQGATSSFVCQKEARASGFRRSLLGVR